MLYALAAIVILGPIIWGVKKAMDRQRIRRNVLNEVETKSDRKVIAALRRAVDRARAGSNRRVRKREDRPSA